MGNSFFIQNGSDLLIIHVYILHTYPEEKCDHHFGTMTLMKNRKKSGHILLVSSLADPAGTLIHEEVRKILDKNPHLQTRYLHKQFDERLIYLNGQALETEADLIIFLSRHSSKEPRSVLTVHVTGNFGEAVFGGSPGTLTPAATAMMYAIMNGLAREVPAGYEVTYEATHHGPTALSTPSCFVEVGSGEQEWQDRNAAAAVARAVIGANPGDVICLAGFGGTHYAQRQTEITLTTRGGFGHIMPTRDLLHLTRDLFNTIIESSDADAVYIDKKSVSNGDFQKITNYALEIGIPVIGQAVLQEIGDLPLDYYLRLLKMSQDIISDPHIHLHYFQPILEPMIITLPGELIEISSRIAQDTFFSGLDGLPIVHISGNGKICLPQFIVEKEKTDMCLKKIIELCISLLLEKYQHNIRISNSITRYIYDTSDYSLPHGELVITEEKFDPSKAKSLGINPGKDFGRLCCGETIIIDGEKITPDLVHIQYERRIIFE
jgi:D-aminoacyl-tRNA deacylase